MSAAPPPRPPVDPQMARQLRRRARVLKELGELAAARLVANPVALGESLKREAELLEAMAAGPSAEEEMVTLRPGWERRHAGHVSG